MPAALISQAGASLLKCRLVHTKKAPLFPIFLLTASVFLLLYEKHHRIFCHNTCKLVSLTSSGVRWSTEIGRTCRCSKFGAWHYLNEVSAFASVTRGGSASAVSPPEDLAQCLVQIISSFVRILVEPDLQGQFSTKDVSCWSDVTEAQWALPSSYVQPVSRQGPPLQGPGTALVL